MNIDISIDVNSLIGDDEWQATISEVVQAEIKDACVRAVRSVSRDLIKNSPELRAKILDFEKRMIDREIKEILG